MSATGGDAGGPAKGSREDFIQNVGDRVFFDFDKSDIKPEGQTDAAAPGRMAEDTMPNVTVTIEGHCDERGTREYNLALGNRRANAVKNALVAARRRRQPHPDHQLRQGSPDRRRLERGGLGAEPRRHHRHQLTAARS